VNCLVVEDAPAGILAGVAGGMATLGVARLDDAALLREAGADLVVKSLDDVDAGALAPGALAQDVLRARGKGSN
jgi:beta-phosphoglucomutase-like phosphatase (HAD superfamily)